MRLLLPAAGPSGPGTRHDPLGGDVGGGDVGGGDLSDRDLGDRDLSDRDLQRLYALPDRGVPRVRVGFVTSADGAATLDGRSEGLSGPDDKRVFRVLRAECDALLVGAGTLRDEGYGPLRLDAERRAGRVARGLPETPTLVVVSGRLDLAPDLPALAQAPVRPVVLTSAGASPEWRSALAGVADVLAVGSRTDPEAVDPAVDPAVDLAVDPAVDLAAALDVLAGRGLRQVLCEGGPRLLGALVAADLVDELCLTVAPLLAGPGPGRIVAGLPTATRALRLHHVLSGAGNLLLRYTRPGPDRR